MYRVRVCDTALHYCAKHHDDAAITLLLLNNGAIEVNNLDGKSPLDVAIAQRRARTLSALVTRSHSRRRIDALLLYGAYYVDQLSNHTLAKSYWRRALTEAEQLAAGKGDTNKKKDKKRSDVGKAFNGFDAEEEWADR